MTLKHLAACFAVAALTGCAAHTVINPSYDLTKIKRVGVIKFAGPADSPAGIEDIFTKYLIENGFSVAERAQLDRIISEQKISVAGYIAPETAKELGKVLGVDALLIGSVVSYTPAKQDTVLIETRNTYEEPIYKKEMTRRPDGSYVEENRPAGSKKTRETLKTPHVYTIYAQIGLVAKLVDIETGEVIWVGSYTNEGADAVSAVEGIASYLMRQFRKDWDTAVKKSNKNG